MRKQFYWPSRMASQVSWLNNWKNKLPTYGSIGSIDAGRITALVADANWLIYIYGAWIGWLRSSAEAGTQYLTVISLGITGGSTLPAPVFTPPAPPTGATAVGAGALTRLFKAVQDIKEGASYTTAVGGDLQIIGTEINPEDHPVPVFTPRVGQGAISQCVDFSIVRYSHEGVLIDSRRGGSWEQIGITTSRTFCDERPLLDPTKPEVREYRMRYWDKGIANGDWTDIAKVTVAP